MRLFATRLPIVGLAGLAGLAGFAGFAGLAGLVGLARPLLAQEDELRRLESPSSIERQQAAEALGAMGETADEVVPALLKALSDANPLVRGAVIVALGEIGHESAIEPLVALLASPDARTRRLCARSLARIGPSVLPALRRALQGPARAAAADACAQLGAKATAARPELEAALDAEPATRVVVVAALLRIDPQHAAARTQLHNLLRSADPVVASQAISAARGQKDAGTVERLIALLHQPQQPLRWKAARTLGALGADARAAIPALTKALRISHFHVQTAAADALGRIGPDALPALLGLLNEDGHVDLVAHACKSMPDAAVPALASRMPSPAAARALAALGPSSKPALPPLRNALGHRDPHVRLESARAIWLVAGDPGVAAVLVPLLRNATPAIRLRAAVTLGSMGPLARKAISALQEATEDRNKSVARAAARALKRIG